MADNGVLVNISGLDQLQARLRALPDVLRKKVIMRALRKAARVVVAKAKQQAPVLKAPSKYRTPGLLKRRLVVRTSRESRRNGNLGVFINVKPAEKNKYSTSVTRIGRVKIKTRRLVKKGTAGAKSRLDPFYWRFVEFGTRKMAAQPFIQPAAEHLDEALLVFVKEAVSTIEAMNKTGI